MAKQFVELNTDLDYNGTTYVPELNGRQGDNNREVYFFIKRGVRPFDLSDKTMTLFMKDAVGGVKTASTINDRAGITAGRFSLLIPKEFYQAEGDTQESFLQIKKDDSVLTTIPLSFKVIANGMSVTQSQSTVYIDSVQKILDELAPRIEATTAGVEANQNAMKALTANIEALNQIYNIDLLAKKTKDNEFTGNNTFSGDVDINGKLTVNNSVVMEKSVETNGDVDTNGKFTGHQKSYFLNGLAINGGGIYVKDGSNLTGDNYLDNATVAGNLTVKGNHELKGHENVLAGLYVEGGVNSKDDVDIYGKTVTHGDTVIDGKIDFNKVVYTHSDVNIFGNINMTKVREADIWDNGLNGHLVRVGNVVMLRIFGGILYDHPAFTKLLWDIPAGFRPVSETDLLASAGYSKGLIKIFPDGSAWNIDTTFKVKDNNGGDGVPYGFGCWVTTDGFPA